MQIRRSEVPAPTQVTVLTHDPALLRWAQASAVGSGSSVVGVAPGQTAGAAGWARWRDDPVVLLGADAVDDLVAAGTPPHHGLHLVAGHEVSPDVLRSALTLGVASVIDPAHGTARVAALLAAVADPRPPGEVVSVGAGSGGAGASVLAAAVAVLAAERGSVVLVLTDPAAADAHLLLGGDADAGATWVDLGGEVATIGPVALRDALPVHGGVHVLGFGPDEAPPEPDVLRAAIDALRAAFDRVVVDVDLRDGPLLAQVRLRSRQVWTVARPTLWELATARARRERCRLDGPVLVRGAALPAAAVELALGQPRVHLMADERRLDEWVDVGAGPLARRRSPLRAAAALVLAELDRVAHP